MYYSPSTTAASGNGGGAALASIEFPRTVCRSASSVLGMIHWQWRTIEVASGVMNAWPPKEERKREVLTFRGAKVSSITPLSDPKAYAKLMKNAADAAAKRPSSVAPITQPAFVRLELPPGVDKDKDKGKTREVFIVVPDDELQAWLRVFTGAQDAARYSLLPEGSEPAMATTLPDAVSSSSAPSPSQAHLKTAPGAMQSPAVRAPMSTSTPANELGSRGSQGSSSSGALLPTPSALAPPPTTGALRGGLGGTPPAVAAGRAGNAQRPMSMGMAPVQRTTSLPGSGPGGRPVSLAMAGPLPGASLPPDPNKMLTTVLEPDAWAIGTQQPSLALDDPDDGPVIISGAEAGASAGTMLAPRSGSGSAGTLPPSPWTEYLDEDGVPYYHNELTNETTWERPPEMDALPMPHVPALPPMPQQLPPPQQMHLPPQQAVPQGAARGGAALTRGGAYGVPRGGFALPRGGAAPVMRGGGGVRGGYAMPAYPQHDGGGALPAYPQQQYGYLQAPQQPGGRGAFVGDATIVEAAQAQAALSAHDAEDVLAQLDEFEDMQFGVGTLPQHVQPGAGGSAGGAVNSPFGSQTLAELDELNNPEFF